jgi:hypothetical protein
MCGYDQQFSEFLGKYRSKQFVGVCNTCLTVGHGGKTATAQRNPAPSTDEKVLRDRQINVLTVALVVLQNYEASPTRVEEIDDLLKTICETIVRALPDWKLSE